MRWNCVLGSALFVMILSGCSQSPPEQEIHANIDAMQQAIKDRDNSGVREHLSEFFLGRAEGKSSLNKQGLQRLLAGYFLRYKHNGVLVSQVELDVDKRTPNRVVMRCTAVLTGAERLVPDAGRIYKVTGLWVLEGGEWRLSELEWL